MNGARNIDMGMHGPPDPPLALTNTCGCLELEYETDTTQAKTEVMKDGPWITIYVIFSIVCYPPFFFKLGATPASPTTNYNFRVTPSIVCRKNILDALCRNKIP
jgi:hypothetical protein